MSDLFGVDVIRSVTGASRYARSYAFLYAAFQRNSSDSSVVKDAIDCLLPFITAYTNSNIGSQVKSEDIQSFVKANFSLDIPIYAIDRSFDDLKKGGYIEWKPGIKIWISLPKENSFSLAREEIETDFEEIESLLTIYATNIGFSLSPPSGSWGQAIISFLKPQSAPTQRSTIKLKDALVDPRDTERKIVGTFIQKLWEEQPSRYEKIVKIFMGILVEDFLSGVSELGAIEKSEKLTIFYDTSLLLRALGSSGTLYKIATDELTRYLQDIGCSIHFLSGNESEVSNVISTILNVADSGNELEGETADAISRGEIRISDLRMLQNGFVERLAAQNIFEFSDTVRAFDAKQYQISEAAFDRFLQDEASKRGRNYGAQNRKNDASYLGIVMRYRGGLKPRDFAKSRFLFVTSNKMLAYASREFLVREGHIQPIHCSPIMHVDQVATIAWLMKDQKLNPQLAARELLVNCYAAARPSAEWFKFFRQGLEEAIGNIDNFSQDPENSFILQSARRIAQEQSFSNSTIMKTLNMAEVLDRSRELSKARELELEKRFSEISTQENVRHTRELIEQESMTKAMELEKYKKEIQNKIKDNCDIYAKNLVRAIQLFLAILFVVSSLSDSFDLFHGRIWLSIMVKIFLGVISVIAFLDLVGFKFVSEQFDKIRNWISMHRQNRLNSKFT